MSDPVFVTIAQVERLHEKSISRFGGALGVRDSLQGHGDLFDIAAAYAYHIAEAQACFEGNERTGVAAAFLFLELNDVSTDFDSIPLYEAMIAVAEKRMNKSQRAQLLRKSCQAI